MLLNVQERLLLLQAFTPPAPPMQGSFAALRLLREFKENLSFSEEEHKEIELRPVDDKMRWNPDKAEDKEVEVGDVVRGMIVRRFKKLSEQDALIEAHLFIADKFPEIEGDD